MSDISVDKQFIELYVKNDVITINIINTLDTGSGGGSGSVQDVSVVSANGFAGTVANPTSSPDITISTTVTGLLKGNGTAVSAAVAGTDYAAASHTHAISDVTNLQTSLDGKASTSHTHAISDVTNLQTTLDGKAASSHTHSLDDLSDVTISAPSNNEVLKYNGSTWVNASAPAGATTLDGLTDVVITSPQVNQTISYDGTNWVNSAPQGGESPASKLFSYYNFI